ncbi:cystatin-A1-like [Cottoperca gobio]|uniref:Cystatin-B n=1 Tax=Cottoperca gobio TaxID=56716 RepID=A0A6J2PK54_COTGO|nr:cystatin-A1-like [Cottoperca gobio]
MTMFHKVKPGEWSETKDATEETQNICDQVKVQVEQKTGKSYVEYKAVEYRNQIVNGENFLFKVFVGGKDYIHLSVFQHLKLRDEVQQQEVLVGVEQDKTKEDPLVPFTN